jgi:hypothetical protein
MALVALAFAAESFYYTRILYYTQKNVEENLWRGSIASLVIDVLALSLDTMIFIRDVRARRDMESRNPLHHTTTNNLIHLGRMLNPRNTIQQ